MEVKVDDRTSPDADALERGWYALQGKKDEVWGAMTEMYDNYQKNTEEEEKRKEKK